MEERKLSRREREKLTQRREMLDAALRLFSQKGYRNVAMSDIAGEAEFAIGTLYRFFRNKEELYKALMLEQVNKFRDAVTKAIEEPDDEIEKLRSYVRAKGEVFCANAATVRLYFAETQGARLNFIAGLDSEIQRRRADFLQSLARVFENGMKKKLFERIAVPFHLAVAMESLTNAFLFLWLDEPERHPYPEDPDVILNILFKGLVGR